VSYTELLIEVAARVLSCRVLVSRQIFWTLRPSGHSNLCFPRFANPNSRGLRDAPGAGAANQKARMDLFL